MTATTTPTTETATTDTRAADAVRAHHERMVDELTELAAALASSEGDDHARARGALVSWTRGELVPHALGEERTFYSAAATLEAGRLLVDSLVADHRVILGVLDALEASTDPAVTAAWADALVRVFSAHAHKENDLVLPLLVASPGVSVADELHAMHGHAG